MCVCFWKCVLVWLAQRAHFYFAFIVQCTVFSFRHIIIVCIFVSFDVFARLPPSVCVCVWMNEWVSECRFGNMNKLDISCSRCMYMYLVVCWTKGKRWINMCTESALKKTSDDSIEWIWMDGWMDVSTWNVWRQEKSQHQRKTQRYNKRYRKTYIHKHTTHTHTITPRKVRKKRTTCFLIHVYGHVVCMSMCRKIYAVTWTYAWKRKWIYYVLWYVCIMCMSWGHTFVSFCAFAIVRALSFYPNLITQYVTSLIPLSIRNKRIHIWS